LLESVDEALLAQELLRRRLLVERHKRVTFELDGLFF
jgi:hypothetical protein